MSVLTALGVLLLVLVVVDLGLTVGIVRRLRGDLAPLRPRTNPERGFRVSLDRDGAEWPAGAAAMLSGHALVAFVAPGCPGCERLRRQIDTAGPPDVPFFVVGDPALGDPAAVLDHLRSWPATAHLVAPRSVDTLDSFGHPDTYPTLVLLSDGVVAASGHRLDDVAESLAKLHARRLIRDAAH